MLTVLMITYNGAKYLREQLDSILNQKGCALRLVISDDGSTDDTPVILREYAERYPQQVEVLLPSGHLGSAARHFFRLIDIVRRRGDDAGYFALSDQDDIWIENKLAACVELLQQRESETGREIPLLVHTDLEVTDAEGNTVAPSMAKHNRMRMDHRSLNYRLVENAVSGNTVVMNRAFWQRLVLPEHCIMHDWWMALAAESIGEVLYYDRATVKYRQHSGNVYGSAKHFTAAEIRENYRNMYRQAQELLDAYGEEMTPERKELLTAFVKMQQKSRLAKIRTVIRYRFYKSRPVMTLGLMWKI